MEDRTFVHFADNTTDILEAYADSGEGIDRAGGFAIQVRVACPSRFRISDWYVQGLGGLLVAKIDGDFNNVVGFPAAAFFKFLGKLVDEEDDFLEV